MDRFARDKQINTNTGMEFKLIVVTKMRGRKVIKDKIENRSGGGLFFDVLKKLFKRNLDF